jgi:Tfp pilus assembly protein PilO
MKLLTPIIIMAVCVGAYFLYISPMISEVKALALKKSEYNDVLNQAKELASKRDSLLTEYNNIPPEQIDRLKKIVPDTFSSDIFANNMNVLAAKYGIVIKEMKVSEPVVEVRDAILTESETSPFKTSVVTMKLSGNFDQFVKFLADVESSLRLIDLNSLSVTGATSKKSTDPEEYTLEMNTYSLR